MKKASQLIAIFAVIFVAGILAYAALGGGEPQYDVQSEEDFLASLRPSGSPAPATAVTGNLLPPQGSIDRPDIEIETHMFDLGVVPHDRTTDAEVMVYNRGNAPLIISKVTTTCGCTTGKMSVDTIPPGGEAALIVHFDPYKIRNKFYSMKTLTLLSNDPTERRVSLNVVANVDPEIRWEPDAAGLGLVAKGESSELTIRMTQNQEKPFQILNALVSAATDVFDVEWEVLPEEQWASPDRCEYAIVAKVRPDAPTGKYNATIEINTDIDRASRVSIPLSAEIRGIYNLQPNQVRMQSIQPGETLKGVISLSAKVPLEVRSVRVKNETFKVTHRIGDNPNQIVFDVTIGDSLEDGLQRDQWVLDIVVGGEAYTESVDVIARVKS